MRIHDIGILGRDAPPCPPEQSNLNAIKYMYSLIYTFFYDFLCRWKVFAASIALLLKSSGVFAENVAQPLLFVPETTYTKDTKIYLANCSDKLLPNAQAKIIAAECLETNVEINSETGATWKIANIAQSSNNFSSIAHELTLRKSGAEMLYAITAKIDSLGKPNIHALHRLNSSTLHSHGNFLFPEGYEISKLLCKSVTINNQQKIILVVSLFNHPQYSDALLFFDVTQSEGKLIPIKQLEIEKLFSDKFKVCSDISPQLWYLKDNQWYLVLAGANDGKPTLCKISLVDYKATTITSEEGLRKATLNVEFKTKAALVGLDYFTKGVVDLAFLYDGQGMVWMLDMTHPVYKPQTHRLINIINTQQEIKHEKETIATNSSSKLLAIPDPKGHGLLLNIFTHGAPLPLVYRIKYNLEEQTFNSKNSLKTLVEFLPQVPLDKNSELFQEAYIRFGRLIVITQNFNQSPMVFTWSKDKWFMLKRNWQNLESQIPNFSNPLSSQSSQLSQLSEVIVSSKLIWDPQNQKDTLLILKDTCQLSTVQSQINSDKYGRQSWSRMAE